MSGGKRSGFGPWRLILPLGLVVAAAAAMLHVQQFDRDQAQLDVALQSSVRVVARLATARAQAMAGTPEGFQALRAAQLLVPGLVSALSRSPAQRWLSPTPPDLRPLVGAWEEAANQSAAVTRLEESVLDLVRDGEQLQSVASGLLVNSDELVDALIAAEARPVQLRAASRQLMLIQRIRTNLHRLMHADAELLAAADRLGRDAVVFGEVATALLNGSQAIGIPRVEDGEAREILAVVGREFRVLARTVEEVMAGASSRVAMARRQAALGRTVSRLESLNDRLHERLAGQEHQRLLTAAHAMGLMALAAVALLAALVLGLVDRRAARRRRAMEDAASAEDRRDLEAVRDGLLQDLDRLAGDVARMADGDLGLRAHTDAGHSPAVDRARAELDRLRHRLGQRSEDGLRLARSSQAVAEVASHLRDTARRHAHQAEEAGQATRIMAAALDALRVETGQLSEAARDSGASARAAGGALTETVHELEAVQAAVDDCAQRVRALESAARELRAVRTLVEDVGELGKMLSLNVAIQASVDSAGSRALTAFSEEVQRLATRARSAVSQVESIHDELRVEAERAAAAVKEGVWRARGAAERVRGARGRLDELSEAARRLETLEHALGRAHRDHAVNVTEVVRAVTAMHAMTREMREQVEAAVDSAAALGERAAVIESRLEAPAAGEDTVIDMSIETGVPDEEAAEAPGEAPRRALERWT